MLPRVIEQYRFFHDRLDRSYVDRYGYLDGFAFAMGPVETAALVIGYENFLVGLLDFPGEIHELLKRMSDFTLAWLRLQESVNGKLKRIYFFDHTPARVRAEHFEDFIFPYLSRVLQEFPAAVRIYHICARHISHVVGRFPERGVDVLYFAADIAEVKAAVGRRLCLMGNLNPIDLLLRGTPQQVAAEARRCASVAADEDGGFIGEGPEDLPLNPKVEKPAAKSPCYTEHELEQLLPPIPDWMRKPPPLPHHPNLFDKERNR